MTINPTILALVIGLILSFAGHVYQYYSNKDSRALDNLRKEMQLMQELNEAKLKAQSETMKIYDENMKRKDLQIESLEKTVQAQNEKIELATSEMKRMQRIVIFLISKSCKDAETCPTHCPFSMNEIGEIIKA